jgi:pyruvate formate lyase activating enzyme
VPIVIGSDDKNTPKQIAETLSPYFNDDNLFIISSDFSHYPKYSDAIQLDKITGDAICSGNPDSLINVINTYKNSDIKNLATNICGWSAVLSLMYLTNENYEFHQIEYKNSGDSEYGSDDRVVGYWAISVCPASKTGFKLSDDEKKQLLELARLTVETKLTENTKPDLSSFKFSDNLKTNCGAFVTLHKNENLRGCIGRFEPNIPLYEVVVDMAITASQNDHRFSPVTISELNEIDFEISVLTPMIKIDSISKIELGRHGIYIKKEYQTGTFLPQVATETGWSLEEFLGHCARDKAGLSYDGWKDADIFTYEAIVFSEEDFDLETKKKTKYYEKLKNKKVICKLCPHECKLSDGQTGLCNARQNENGELTSLSYGKIVAIHIDPIEKKPLYHFKPGSQTFSIGTAGCNLHCKNCQNSDISQKSPAELDFTETTPEQIVNSAIENGCNSISYTYTEPTIFYEYMLETAKLAHEKGLKNIIVSNGYINKKPLLELIPYIDAANIDLKCFNDSIYRKITTARLQPVLNTLKTLKDNGVWLEITNLVIPSYTDDLKMIEEMCEWLVDNGFENVPLHFNRFHPSYKMQDVPSTSIETLDKAYEIAKSKGINYVYLGNLRTEKTNTYCPYCGTIIIKRNGFETNVKDFTGVCPKCGKEINGIW